MVERALGSSIGSIEAPGDMCLKYSYGSVFRCGFAILDLFSAFSFFANGFIF